MIYFIYNNKTKDGLTNLSKKRGLLLLYGESFRVGTQGSRVRDTDESFELQKKASDSHMRFCNHIQNKYTIDMDVLINTYDTKYDTELKSFYKNYTYMTNKTLIGSNNLVQSAVDTIIDNKYEFIFITRIDIYIKPYFFSIFTPFWNKIYFISQNWTLWQNCGFIESNDTGINIPVVNPLFQFIPRTHFKVLKNINVEHEGWMHYFKNFGLSINDMDFMVNTYHDADSFKDYNPFYKMIGRPETDKWHDADKTIDRSLIETKNKISC